MASLASRISLIVRSKANALIDSLEDPSEVVDQTIVDAKKGVCRTSQAVERCIRK